MVTVVVFTKAARPVRPTHAIVAPTFGEPSTDVYRNMASVANRLQEAFAALTAPLDGPHLQHAVMMRDWRAIVAGLDWVGFVRAANRAVTPIRHTVQSFGRLEVTPPEQQRPIRKDAKVEVPISTSGQANLFTDIDARAVQIAAKQGGTLIVAVSQQVRDVVRAQVADSMTGKMTVDQLARVLRTAIPLTPTDAASVLKQQDRLYQEARAAGQSDAAAASVASAAADRLTAGRLAARAMNIARTEIVTASNQGRYAAWQAQMTAGLTDPGSIKQWVAAGDACPACQALDGEQQPWDAPFSTGDDMPPDHPSCRCSAVMLPPDQATSALGTGQGSSDGGMDALTVGPDDSGTTQYVQDALAQVTDAGTASAAAGAFTPAVEDADQLQRSLTAMQDLRYMARLTPEQFAWSNPTGDKGLQAIFDSSRGLKDADLQAGITDLQERIKIAQAAAAEQSTASAVQAVVAKVTKEAAAAEPAITADMKAFAAENHATLEGLDFRLKGAGSMARKISADAAMMGGDVEQAAAGIRDAVRYTMVMDPAEYATGAGQTLASLQGKGWQIAKVKNFWTVADNPYQGINVQLRSPSGQWVELQFHTPDSLRVKEGELHTLYEEQRVTKDPVLYERLGQQMHEVAAKIPVPPNVASVRAP